MLGVLLLTLGPATAQFHDDDDANAPSTPVYSLLGSATPTDAPAEADHDGATSAAFEFSAPGHVLAAPPGAANDRSLALANLTGNTFSGHTVDLPTGNTAVVPVASRSGAGLLVVKAGAVTVVLGSLIALGIAGGRALLRNRARLAGA